MWTNEQLYILELWFNALTIVYIISGMYHIYRIWFPETNKDYCPSCKGTVEFEEITSPLPLMRCKTCGYEMGCLKWKLHYRGKGFLTKEKGKHD